MLKKRLMSLVVAGLSLVALGLVSVGSASAANLKETGVAEPTGFLAIYGTPAANGTAIPVGGGLGRNFGFGANLLFEASAKTPQKALRIVLPGPIVSEAAESFIGGTLMSNKTGKGVPLSFAVQFADLQNNKAGEEKKEVASQLYTDTFDQPWIAEICSPAIAKEECKTEPRFFAPEKTGQVHIQNVSFQIATAAGPLTVQGDVWGVWTNGPKEKEPPCIELTAPPAGATASETLLVTRTSAGLPAVGSAIASISGKACLVSANNYWYSGKEPAIEIANE